MIYVLLGYIVVGLVFSGAAYSSALEGEKIKLENVVCAILTAMVAGTFWFFVVLAWLLIKIGRKYGV